jgi:hypothetical protein
MLFVLPYETEQIDNLKLRIHRLLYFEQQAVINTSEDTKVTVTGIS